MNPFRCADRLERESLNYLAAYLTVTAWAHLEASEATDEGERKTSS
jgi:hypothetical protein